MKGKCRKAEKHLLELSSSVLFVDAVATAAVAVAIVAVVLVVLLVVVPAVLLVVVLDFPELGRQSGATTSVRTTPASTPGNRN